MMESCSVGSLFLEWRESWGLRGDPELYQEMREILLQEPLSASVNQLISLLETTFERLVGAPISSPLPMVYVARYDHGGMSGGQVSIPFWRDRVLPRLQEQYMSLRSSQTASAQPCRFEMNPEGCRFGSSCHYRHSFPPSPASTLQQQQLPRGMFVGGSPGGSNVGLARQQPFFPPPSAAPHHGHGQPTGSLGGNRIQTPHAVTFPPGMVGPRGQPICFHFLRGNCRYGAACRFGHI